MNSLYMFKTVRPYLTFRNCLNGYMNLLKDKNKMDCDLEKYSTKSIGKVINLTVGHI